MVLYQLWPSSRVTSSLPRAQVSLWMQMRSCICKNSVNSTAPCAYKSSLQIAHIYSCLLWTFLYGPALPWNPSAWHLKWGDSHSSSDVVDWAEMWVPNPSTSYSPVPSFDHIFSLSSPFVTISIWVYNHLTDMFLLSVTLQHGGTSSDCQVNCYKPIFPGV